ncbi:Vacuolar protein sorting-associated protein 11-like protein [Golovinomyces cichoracearum]|uniref:E3 ubiquitin-protein ligase PEP5 n=1 Tax=Golovinomyces cichoracearum TaxID=62708 RepID=A0A420I5X2_9PEZI|nr:Vacuolar protein sorting-associated protein 11-like protein [Golovinomyces cichoracearum]
MALTSWKTFDFFEVSQITPADDDTRCRLENNEISSICCGSENLFLGGKDGTVQILSSEFKILRMFKAYDSGSITYMKQIEGTYLLVTIAEDISNEPVLKVWAVNKLVKKTGLPTCQSTLSIQNGRKPFPITAVAIMDDLSQLAVGFGNGSVTIVRGDLIYDRGAKQRTVFESEEPITGLEIRDESRIMTLYISTTSRILKLQIIGRGQGQAARVVEDTGCALGCMTLDKTNGNIVVVRDDAIYYYGIDGRGPCYAYDGPKDLVASFKDYIVLVSPLIPSPKSPRYSTNLRRFGESRANEIFNTSTFTLLDTGLKFIAYSESLVSRIKSIFEIWGDLFTLTQDGKIYRYREKPLQQRLENLYQRNLFVLAISLAQKSKMDVSDQNIIFGKYGDFLYQKADYDGAMQQYLKAIDNIEPSQVIRKFLDTQRIHNLIEFLEELHEHHKANSDHTTLLLNCYAKLKDVDKLEKFIKSPSDLKFDLETAISMCRQGGYFDQATYLSEKNHEHELVVDILIEDSQMYDQALDYLSRLDPDSVHTSLMKHARILLENCPKRTTQLFIQIFTGRFRTKMDIPSPLAQTQQIGYAAGAVNAVQNLKDFLPLQYINKSTASPDTVGDIVEVEPTQKDVTETETLKFTIPQPRTAFSSFLDHPNEFIEFLEACLKEKNLKDQDITDLSTTLFEMYLQKSQELKGADSEYWESKAKKLIENKENPIDTSTILLLSHLTDFRDGSKLVREQAGLRFDIYRNYASAKNTSGVIEALKKYGSLEPQLYPAALAYFTSDPQILEEAADEIEKVLKKIDEDGLMAPLQVIQTLSTNGVATMGMVKNYLNQTIERERNEIALNRRLIESYRSETIQKRKEISNLSTQPQVFNNTRCQFCGLQLSLPIIHFLCKHSFHQTCLNIDIEANGSIEGSCPSCKKDNDTIRAIRKAQDESSDRHDLFLDALARSEDRFGTISEFFGRGIMDVATLN